MQKFFVLLTALLIINVVRAQQQPDTTIDVQHYRFALAINDSNNVIKGEAVVTIKFLQDVSALKLDLVQQKPGGKGMLVSAVAQDGNNVSFVQDTQHVVIQSVAKAGQVASYTIKYEGIPADGLIISTNRYGHRTFFGDNWPNRAHNWLPCKDHLSDKASVEFIVTAPGHYQVVSNGVQTEETNLPNHTRLTHWVSEAELPTKVMVIGAADFAVNYIGNVNDIPVYSWVYPEDRDSGFATYAMAKDILPWFIYHVGPYAYKKLANVQSKTIFGGMENASAIFYYEQSVSSPAAEGLMAHEIAHQWFGNTATEKNWQHLWLSEGFATYMTHLYIESKYGKDSMNRSLAEDRKTIIAFSKKRNTPIVDTTFGNDMMQLLNAFSYQKGGWVLHMLRHRLGDALFWQGVRAYYAAYAGKNASTGDLQKIFENTSKQSLDTFFKQWVYTPGLPKLGVVWKYKKGEKAIEVNINQTQTNLFEFPLEIAINTPGGAVYKTVNVTGRHTAITIPVNEKPSSLSLDPGTNLLFDGEIRLQPIVD